jgi:hypothetical protein
VLTHALAVTVLVLLLGLLMAASSVHAILTMGVVGFTLFLFLSIDWIATPIDVVALILVVVSATLFVLAAVEPIRSVMRRVQLAAALSGSLPASALSASCGSLLRLL